MLKVPAKYKRSGIKIKCLKCRYEVHDKCPVSKKSATSCQHKDKHRYNLIVCIPHSKSRRSKILDTNDFDNALSELQKFREQLKVEGFHKTKVGRKPVRRTTVKAFAIAFLDAMSGVNTPPHLLRKRSDDYVSECRRVIERFCKSLKVRGYKLDALDLKDIGDDHVGIFHSYLKDDLSLGQRSYNKHLVIMKAFFNWVIEKQEYRKASNPFRHVELQFPKTEPNIISKEEFDKLITVITKENGIGKDGENHYREFLPFAFRLALESGLRREELAVLRWSDVVEMGNVVSVFKIQNLKVNRILNGGDEGTNVKHVPITKSLMLLLNEMGYAEKKNTHGYVLERHGLSTKHLMEIFSRAFGHYIKLVTDRKINFKDLRKTYISHLTMFLGEKTKLFTGHSNDEVLKNHYLNTAFIAGGLCDFQMF